MLFNETSFSNLYKNIEMGFPTTKYRQHATHPIKIINFEWTPFIGMKTLFVRGIAESNDKEYSPMILFKRVNFSLNEEKHVNIVSNGKKYFFEKLSLENNDVLVRCNCGDFKYRFSYYNKLGKSLYGTVTSKYESQGLRGPINPQKVSGLCKHCIKIFEVLNNSDMFK